MQNRVLERYPIHYRKPGELVALCGQVTTTRVNTTRSGAKVTCSPCHKLLFNAPVRLKPEYGLRDWLCPRCRKVQAQTDGESIYFDGKKVPLDPLRLMWTCKFCRSEVKWQSTRKRKGLPTGGEVG